MSSDERWKALYDVADTSWGGYELPTGSKPKCECGVTVTLGKDDHPEHHSEYCDIYKEWKNKNET